MLLAVASFAEATSSSSSDWWIESSLVRLFPTSTPARTDATNTAAPAATVSLAGNEHESFQLGLRLPPSSPNTSYAVSISADDDDHQVNITWEQVGWVYVTEIAPNNQSAAGWWPDPLLRVPKVLATSGEATAYVNNPTE